MASKRMIHIAMFSNPELGELDIQVRYFYIGLIAHSDDDGRMKANIKFLKAKIFPFDFRLRLETLQEWLGILSHAKLISLYAVGGQDYLHHPNWKKWQTIRKDRYNPSDCPPPEKGVANKGDTEMTTKCQPDDSHWLPQPNLTQPNLTKEIHKSKKRESKYDFNSIWDKYPKKLGKDKALEFFTNQVLTDQDFTDMQLAVAKFAKHCEGQDHQYIPYGSNWFNKRWRDWVKYSEPEPEVIDPSDPRNFLKKGKI